MENAKARIATAMLAVYCHHYAQDQEPWHSAMATGRASSISMTTVSGYAKHLGCEAIVRAKQNR